MWLRLFYAEKIICKDIPSHTAASQHGGANSISLHSFLFFVFFFSAPDITHVDFNFTWNVNQPKLKNMLTPEELSKDLAEAQAAAAGGELDELRGVAFCNRTWIITDRFYRPGGSLESVEDFLHSLWHMYYQLGRHTSSKSSEQDGLVLDIVRMQARGGTLWTDMPLLVSDITGFWVNEFASLSGVQRLNLASFVAKLVSARVACDRLSVIGLALFRDTLEQTRYLGRSGEANDEEDAKRQPEDFTVAQLLPLVHVWIKEADRIFIQLSESSWTEAPDSSTLGQEGPILRQWLAQTQPSSKSGSGFSAWRWMFWLKRLHRIRDAAKEAKDQSLEECAQHTLEMMNRSTEERNSHIINVYQNGGG